MALRQRFEAIRQSELRRLEPKLAGLGPDARAKVDEITRLIVEKLLINPTEQLKSLSDADTVAAPPRLVLPLHDQMRLELRAVVDVAVRVVDLCRARARVQQDAEPEEQSPEEAR